jgi:hypothetical protein
MKWYSVKEYRPANACTVCIVRTKGGGIYIAYNCEYGNRYEWIECHGDEEVLEDVTHFCIPDPISKVFEELIEDKKKQKQYEQEKYEEELNQMGR